MNKGSNVKDTVKSAYENNKNILYVQLVGDWADIKSDTLNDGSPMDPMLGRVVGSDYYPDIIIGRFSANDASHVATQVDKAVRYEKSPDPDGSWYSVGLGIGSEEGAGQGDDGTSKVIVHEDLTCFTTNDPFICDDTPSDLLSHGTHVSGIALGTGKESSGKYASMAPGASLLNIKALNRNGIGLETDIIRGIEIALLGTNDIRGDEPTIEADVINMSLGSYVMDQSIDPIQSVIENMVTKYGVPFIVAAGNYGPGKFSIGSPAVNPMVVAVGSAMSYKPNAVSSFSSRGPTLSHALKPDIIAPGAFIVSACAADSGLCQNGDAYIENSGTSMAAPMVAGAVALLIQQAHQKGENLDWMQIKDRLLNQADIVTSCDGLPNPATIRDQGSGLIRIDRSLQSEVVFSPANISFGLIPCDQPSAKSTLYLTNNANHTKQIQLDWYFGDDKGNDFKQAVSFTPSEFVIGPGETQPVTLELNMTVLPPMQHLRYLEGRVFVFDFGKLAAHSMFGLTQEGEKTTLRVTLISPDGPGGDIDPFSSVRIYDAQKKAGYHDFIHLDPMDIIPGVDPVLEIRVPVDSIYNLVFNTMKFAISEEPTIETYRINHYEIPVGRTPVEVTLDASKAGPVSLNIADDPNADMSKAAFDFYKFYRRPNGTLVASGSTGYGFPGYNVHSNNQPTLGSTLVFNRWSCKGSTTEAGEELWYHWTDSREHDEPHALVVTERDLDSAAVATIRSNSESPLTGSLEWTACPSDVELFQGRCSDIVIFPMPNAQNPINQKAFFKPLEAGFKLHWAPQLEIMQAAYFFEDNRVTQIEGVDLIGRIWRPGEHAVLELGLRTSKPNLTSVARKKNRLEIFGTTLMDPYGLTGSPYVTWKDGFEVEIWIDGIQTVEYKRDFLGGLHLDLSPCHKEFIDVRLHAMTNPAWFTYPVETDTNIRFWSFPYKQGEISIPQTRYQVDNLNRNNRVACTGNGKCRIKFDILFDSTTDHVGWKYLMFGLVSLSTDGGKNWFMPDRIVMGAKSLRIKSTLRMQEAQIEIPISVRLFGMTYPGIIIDETVSNAILLEKEPAGTK